MGLRLHERCACVEGGTVMNRPRQSARPGASPARSKPCPRLARCAPRLAYRSHRRDAPAQRPRVPHWALESRFGTPPAVPAPRLALLESAPRRTVGLGSSRELLEKFFAKPLESRLF